MKERFEAAPFLTRDHRVAYGVVDHKPFEWVKDKDGKALRFASPEEARAWVGRREHPDGAEAPRA